MFEDELGEDGLCAYDGGSLFNTEIFGEGVQK
jgi:hypothetical protein